MDDVILPLEKAVVVRIEHNRIVIWKVVFIQSRGFRFGRNAIRIAVVFFVCDKVDLFVRLGGLFDSNVFMSIRWIVAFRWEG